MDSYEATKIVLARIQKLDPENATKIIGLLLIQDHGEKEMISPLSSPGTPCSPLPFTRQFSSNSRGFNGVNLPSPLSIPTHNGVFSSNSFPSHYKSPNGVSNVGNVSGLSSKMNSSAVPFYGNGENSEGVDEIPMPFLNDGPNSTDFYYPQPDLVLSPDSNVDGMLFNSSWGGGNHRRSYSVSDTCFNSEDSSEGFGWKPCLYFAKGYCKNGANCRFVHGGGLSDSDGNSNMGGSPNNIDIMERCHELLRSKSAQQQRLAAASQFMSGASGFSYSPRAAMALMMGDEINKFSRSPRFERSEFSMSPESRQIYLTFPADSTFREEDVSSYFSNYGPVQDVRIPYQQKRMFGFVTFVYPDTVKLILAKGNPHFVCDARVLVKPYKEKGKVPDKFRKHQQIERSEFLSCGSPTGLDSRDPFDMQLGAKMLYNSQDALWRKKLEEQADLEHAIELQNRRLMELQLLDVKSKHHLAFSSSAAIPFPSAAHSLNYFQQSILVPSNRSSPEFSEENGPKNAAFTNIQQAANGSDQDTDPPSNENSNGNTSPRYDENIDFDESMEQSLPENLFASPKAADEHITTFSIDTTEPAVKKIGTVVSSPSSVNNNLMTSSLLPASSTLDMASLNSCYFQAPRFSNHGAIEM
ncbi:Zinc finger CCCH domain-containing protein 53 [Heracleum sosnowskyi]|uniref:Zinc finger CCCH domain-containing protein 53 n=1 Tax=Heracleum sosnowskyi TaxID=360622 RepID=A0AAD8JDH6_9APIA|nr:Zinc finger CCCH domain-containing protein 53 [Heracleum sosnowskyi]